MTDVPAGVQAEKGNEWAIQFPDLNSLSDSEKLDFLIQSLMMTQQQVAWLCQQLHHAMQAINANPMLRKVMGR